jgi:hypothetical protein
MVALDVIALQQLIETCQFRFVSRAQCVLLAGNAAKAKYAAAMHRRSHSPQRFWTMFSQMGRVLFTEAINAPSS